MQNIDQQISSGKCPPKLTDSFGRQIKYLRISVTDRCNLRCTYCMPSEGITTIPHNKILRFEEIERLIDIFTSFGIEKVRFTGGEPFVRKGFVGLLDKVSRNENLKSVNITTNGVLLTKHAAQLEKLNIENINLSLDSLDEYNFEKITRKNNLKDVLDSLDWLLKSNIKTKINCVVQADIYKEQIKNLSELTINNDVEVRFIEQMPFNGSGANNVFTSKDTLAYIKNIYSEVQEIQTKRNTAVNYKIKGAKGTIGLISSYERSFCDSCNRLRITSIGMMKNCLYDNGVLDLRELLRSEKSDDEIRALIINSVGKKLKDGHEAEKYLNKFDSMSSIGG
ncbi:MAG: GTP 3',8-cyclase MoaA [Melioribacteraceae bacterium]|nr:GTP 3',8-cyclase MoaA [Melioribacteraceae bacterium]